MIITKVQYGKTYSLGNYCSERIDLEASIDESSESVTDAVFQLREYCDQLHKTNNPHLYQEQDTIRLDKEVWEQNTSEPLPTNVPILTQEQKIHNLITQSTSLPELKQWELLSKNKQYPSLKEAYTQKYTQLTTPNKV